MTVLWKEFPNRSVGDIHSTPPGIRVVYPAVLRTVGRMDLTKKKSLELSWCERFRPASRFEQFITSIINILFITLTCNAET